MSQPPQVRFEGGAMHMVIDLRVYRLRAVQKTGYRLADRCTLILGSPEDDRLPVSLTFRSGVTETAASEIARLFFQELLDQELREAIAEETAPIRALILAQAFSKTDLIRHE